MELLTPGFGLIFWQLIGIASFVLLITAWIIILIDKSIVAEKKLSWMVMAAIFPLVGPLYFFFVYRKLRSATALK
jgi:hypothetical protein